MRCRGGSAAPAPIAHAPAAHILPRLGIIKEMLPNFSGDPERKDFFKKKHHWHVGIWVRTRFWSPAATPHIKHTNTHGQTHNDMIHPWPTEPVFTSKHVVMTEKICNLLSRKSVYVFASIQYVYAAAVWQRCTAQRTGWIIPTPSKDPHLRSSGPDTYSESPKLSLTPWGQQRPTRKRESNREIGRNVTEEEKA